jgi:hypothetical protein
MNDPEKSALDMLQNEIVELLAKNRRGLYTTVIAAYLVSAGRYTPAYVNDQIKAALADLVIHGRVILMSDRYYPGDIGSGTTFVMPESLYECMMQTLTEEIAELVDKFEAGQDVVVSTGRLHGLTSALILFEVRPEEKQPKDLIQRAQAQLNRMQAKLDDFHMFRLGKTPRALYDGMVAALANNEAGTGHSVSDGWEMLGMARVLDLLCLWPAGANRDSLMQHIEAQIARDVEGMRARYAHEKVTSTSGR